MEQEGTYSVKGKEVYSEWPSLVSPSSVRTLSSPASLFLLPLYTHVFFKGSF